VEKNENLFVKLYSWTNDIVLYWMFISGFLLHIFGMAYVVYILVRNILR